MSPSNSRAAAFLAGFRHHHGSLAEPALDYLGSLGPVEFRQVNLVALSDALHYLEVARVVADLSDPDEGFEAFARLTEDFGLPEAAELLDRVVPGADLVPADATTTDPPAAESAGPTGLDASVSHDDTEGPDGDFR